MPQLTGRKNLFQLMELSMHGATDHDCASNDGDTRECTRIVLWQNEGKAVWALWQPIPLLPQGCMSLTDSPHAQRSFANDSCATGVLRMYIVPHPSDGVLSMAPCKMTTKQSTEDADTYLTRLK